VLMHGLFFVTLRVTFNEPLENRQVRHCSHCTDCPGQKKDKSEKGGAHRYLLC
jgi:hypothetical protein